MATKKGSDPKPGKEPSREAQPQGEGSATAPAAESSPSDASSSKEGLPVVGIGASAGGLEAFKNFFTAMPSDSGMAFVLIQHLDPTHESMMVDLLTKYTDMRVVQIENRMAVLPNHVYMIPPNAYLTISDGVLYLTEPIPRRGMRMPIDYFFRSLAEDQQEKAICIILSGTGTDGTLGMKAIKGEGGMVMVQDPHSAQYDGMPQSAIGTGIVDFVLPVEMMPETLIKYVGHSYIHDALDRKLLNRKTPDDFKTILAVLRTRANHDFRYYKDATLTRRVRRRMGLKQIEQYSDYVKLLRDDPAEVKALYRDLLIGVTAFFRDADAWQDVAEVIISRLVHEKAPDAPLRVWVPGCASGEEAYSLAIVLIEELKKAQSNHVVQIFASDVDDEALEFARNGVYPESIAADLTPERLRRFFVHEEQTYRVGKELRDMVVFASQNLVTDPPFSKLDLISCRNLLIYLEPTIQHKVISLFHFALAEGGYLFLGPSETIGPQSDMFMPVSKKWRIYRRIGPVRHDKVDFPIVFAADDCRVEPPTAHLILPRRGSLADLTQQILLDQYAPASVLMNRKYEGLYFFGTIADYLEVPSGEPTQDLTLMARDGLRTKLRAAVHRAVRDNGPVSVKAARVKRDGEHFAVRLTVRPVQSPRSAEGLLLVTFEDLPETSEEKAAAISAASDEPLVRQLEYELQATKEDLQSTIEELETSNEELKASNEEVMSMNEELQSSNEELETSKEELQSLNEELNTVNNQLQDKVQELESTNNDMSNLLNSTDIATIFLDRELSLKRFTHATTKLLNLISTDVGRPIDDISRKFTDDELLDDAKRVLHKLSAIEKEVRTDGGNWYIRRIVPYRTMDDKIDGVVITLDDVTQLKRSETALREARDELERRVQDRTAELRERQAKLSAILETAADGIITIDEMGVIDSVNRAAELMFGYSTEELSGRNVSMLMPAPFREEHDGYLERYRTTGENRIIGIGREVVGRRKDGTTFPVDLSVSEVPLGEHRLFTGLVRDISDRREAAEQIELLGEAVRNLSEGVIITDAEIEWPGPKIVFANEAMSQISGYSTDELLGQTPRLLQGERSDRSALDRIKQSLKAVQPIVIEVVNYRKDGTSYHVELSITPVKNGDGEPTHYVSIHQDITERKAADERLLQSERLAALGEAMAGLAHESRNALQRGQSAVQMLARRLEDRPELLEFITRMETAQDDLARLYEDVRQYAAPVTLNAEPCDVREVLRDAWDRLESVRTETHAELHEDDRSSNPVCPVDRFSIRQVFRNILENALAASPNPARIVVEYADAQLDDAPAFQVAIRDNGPGLAPEAKHRIFDAFYTTKTHGTGLGMAISKRLVEAHHGQIAVGRDSSGGAEILVVLPRKNT